MIFGGKGGDLLGEISRMFCRYHVKADTRLVRSGGSVVGMYGNARIAMIDTREKGTATGEL